MMRAFEAPTRRQQALGFSIVELLLALALVSLLTIAVGGFFSQSMGDYYDIRKRTETMQSVEWAIRRIQTEIRRAVPRTLRATPVAIEFLHIADAGRYRGAGGVDSSGTEQGQNALILNQQVSAFNLTGLLNDITPGQLPQYRIAIAPDSPTAAYSSLANGSLTGPITPAQTLSLFEGSSEDNIALESPSSHTFLTGSTEQRVFLVDTPVQYRCDLANKRLVRHADYTPRAELELPTDGRSATLLENVNSCQFDVVTRNLDTGYSELMARLEVNDGSRNESPFTIVLQAQVINLQ